MTTTTTAAPCALCRTTAGATDLPTGHVIRKRRLCVACYERERRAGHLARWSLTRPTPVAHTCAHCGGAFLALASTGQRYCSCACAARDRFDEHPAPLPAVITPAMLGITPGQIAARCRTAREILWADTGLAALRGASWLLAHPEQFTPDHLAALFGGDPALAFWREDAAAAA